MVSNSNQPIRFGCIGCGGIGWIHARNSQFEPGMKVVAFADVDKTKAQKFCDTFQGEYATENAQKIIEDPSIDAVMIQTGVKHHANLAIAAAKAGKHIFGEKPIAGNYTDAMEVIQAVKKHKVKYLMAFCNRLAPLVIRAKRLCPKPAMSYCQCTDKISWQACHNLDLALHVFHDARLETVYAAGGNYWNSEPTYSIDGCAVVLRFADGSIHNYLQHGTARNPLLKKYHYQLFGCDNTCVFLADRFKSLHYCLKSNLEHSMVYQGDDSSEPNVDPRADVRGVYGYMGHFEQLGLLCHAIRENLEVPMTAEQGAYVLAVELAMIKSAESGSVIVMDDFLKDLQDKAKIPNG